MYLFILETKLSELRFQAIYKTMPKVFYCWCNLSLLVDRDFWDTLYISESSRMLGLLLSDVCFFVIENSKGNTLRASRGENCEQISFIITDECRVFSHLHDDDIVHHTANF